RVIGQSKRERFVERYPGSCALRLSTRWGMGMAPLNDEPGPASCLFTPTKTGTSPAARAPPRSPGSGHRPPVGSAAFDYDLAQRFGCAHPSYRLQTEASP